MPRKTIYLLTNWMDSRAGTDNNGADTRGKVNTKVAGAGTYRSLSITKDSIPKGASISRATIDLTVFVGTGGTDMDNEASSGALDISHYLATKNPVTEANSSWNNYDTDKAWSSGGGDYNEYPRTVVTLETSYSDNDVLSHRVTRHLRRSGVIRHATPCLIHRFAYEGSGPPGNLLSYYSNADSTESKRPTLTVHYQKRLRTRPLGRSLIGY